MADLHGKIATWVAFVYSVWTLRLDFTKYYGWQRGAWKSKFTHWGYLLDVLFLLFAALSLLAEPLPQLATTILRRVLYLSATLTLQIDFGFLLILFPRRLLGLEKALQIMSAGSFHKHVWNAVWVFGVASLNPVWDHIDDNEFFLYGTVLPCIVASAYLLFACLVKSETHAKVTLHFFGIELPPEPLPSNPAAIPKTELPNITAIPG